MRQTKETSGLVLVVEDNRNISEMIGEYLEGAASKSTTPRMGWTVIVWRPRTATTWSCWT